MPRIPPDRRLELLAGARVGRLATVTADGRPHVVPCCFAVVPDTGGGAPPMQGVRIYSAVDDKPKSTRELKRLDNVRAHPWATLLVDRYAEDWSELWWIRVDGVAAVVGTEAERSTAVSALAAKYSQYRRQPPTGAVVRIVVDHWTDWAASSTHRPTGPTEPTGATEPTGSPPSR